MTEDSESEYVDFEKLKEKLRHFTRRRDWEKFETPKDLAIAISVEAGELLEMFQWLKESDMKSIKENEQVRERIKSELEEVVRNCFSMAKALGIELSV